jgi:hypothetical protein
MATISLSDNQLKLIEKALEFYARVGIGQMWAIKDHPSFEKILEEKLRPKKEIELGDQTPMGIVVEISEDTITTEGIWVGVKERRTHRREDVRLSIDYGEYHSIRDAGEKQLNKGRDILLGENLHDNASFGIHNPKVDDSCREAFDLVQLIRHEFWKRNPHKSFSTVDSSVSLISEDSKKIKIELG